MLLVFQGLELSKELLEIKLLTSRTIAKRIISGSYNILQQHYLEYIHLARRQRLTRKT